MGQYLNGKTVYLCGSIHKLGDSGIAWREAITPNLNKLGIKVLDPCKKIANTLASEIGSDKEIFRNTIMAEKWGDLKKNFWPIVRYDLRCIDHCDFIIVNYDPTIPTVGTIHELVVATFEKKVILLKYDKSQLDSFNPWIATFIKEHHFFSEWDAMFQHLSAVNDGNFDTSLWVI